jgi:hypothetical protein
MNVKNSKNLQASLIGLGLSNSIASPLHHFDGFQKEAEDTSTVSY